MFRKAWGRLPGWLKATLEFVAGLAFLAFAIAFWAFPAICIELKWGGDWGVPIWMFAVIALFIWRVYDRSR